MGGGQKLHYENRPPIRDEKKIEAMKKILKGKSLRDNAFFTLGINTGLRISDITVLRYYEDLKNLKVLEQKIKN